MQLVLFRAAPLVWCSSPGDDGWISACKTRDIKIKHDMHAIEAFLAPFQTITVHPPEHMQILRAPRVQSGSGTKSKWKTPSGDNGVVLSKSIMRVLTSEWQVQRCYSAQNLRHEHNQISSSFDIATFFLPCFVLMPFSSNLEIHSESLQVCHQYPTTGKPVHKRNALWAHAVSNTSRHVSYILI